jgi:hypothetical protein
MAIHCRAVKNSLRGTISYYKSIIFSAFFKNRIMTPRHFSSASVCKLLTSFCAGMAAFIFAFFDRSIRFLILKNTEITIPNKPAQKFMENYARLL